MNYFIREVKLSDSLEIINHYNVVGGETEYHTFGENGYGKTEEHQKKKIQSSLSDSDSVFLVAIVNCKIVGILTAFPGSSLRTHHTLNLGISIQKEFWGQGIGNTMMEELEKYIKKCSTRKINLIVHKSNQKAINLYLKHGYLIEGTITRYFQINNIFYDALHMGKEIN